MLLKLMQRSLVALAVAFLLSTAVFTSVHAQGGCVLRESAGKTIVTIARGPCWYRDFPANCIVPDRVTVGQRLYCPKPVSHEHKPM